MRRFVLECLVLGFCLAVFYLVLVFAAAIFEPLS